MVNNALVEQLCVFLLVFYNCPVNGRHFFWYWGLFATAESTSLRISQDKPSLSNLFSPLTNSCLSRIQFVKYRWWVSWFWHFDFLFSEIHFLGLWRLYFKCKHTKKAEKTKCLQKHWSFVYYREMGKWNWLAAVPHLFLTFSLNLY